jgi:PKD repeat protein
LWTHTGTGTLFNANTLTPTYFPGPGETGTVTFTLTASGNGSCASVNDQMVLTITPSPTVNAGSDAETCQGLSFNFSSQTTPASATNFASLLWTHTGTGTLVNATTLTPTYTPGVGETGTVTFTLTASGNGSCAAVNDAMVLTITPAPTVNAGSDAETCQGLSFNFSTQTTPASAANFASLLWTHTGTGTLFNANTLTPTYFPGPGETGTVTFTLTASGNGSCAAVNDQMVLTITPSPTVNAGSDAETCQGVSFNFSSQTTPASATNFAGLLWTHTGTGTLFNATTLTPTYTPGVGETGTVTFTLTANGNGSCAAVNDQMVLTITPSPTVNAGSDAETCQGVSFNFSTQTTPASATNFASLLWTHTGTGTLFNANTLTPTYFPGPGETGTVTFTLTASGNGSCAAVNDQMVLTITPSPTVNAGSDAETCQGVSFNFSSQTTPASATNFASLLWTHTGTGTLVNATTLTPTYTPGVGETGTVTFTLTANGNGSCASVNDAMVLTITPSPTVNAGSDAEICQGGVFAFSGQALPATASNFSTLVWSHTGSGSLFNGSTLTPTYFAAPSETGTITFTLTAFGQGSCASVSDGMVLTITPAPVAIAGNNDAICEGTPTFDFAMRTTPASFANGTVLWTHTGAGSLSSNTAINPVYTVHPSDVNTIITFTLTVTSPSPVCLPRQSQFTLNVNRAAIVSVPLPATVCEPQRINLSGTIGGGASSGAWSLITGGGTLSVSSITGLNITATYDTVRADVGNTLVFRLTAFDPDGFGPCTDVFADYAVTIEEAPKVFAGDDFAICEYDNINLQGSFGGSATSVTWSGGVPAQFGDINNPITSYTLNSSERAATNLVMTFTLTTDDPVGVCSSVSDQVKVTVNDTLNFVTFTGLNPIYQEDHPPVFLSGVPSPGVFTGPGIVAGTNEFVPSNANLGINVITYTYNDPLTGCLSSPRQTTVVNPITDINWEVRLPSAYTVPAPIIDGKQQFCATVRPGYVLLLGDPDVLDLGSQSPTSPPFFTIFPDGSPSYIEKIGGQFYINTKNLPPGTYLVTYTFTNQYEATTQLSKFIKVLAAPKAIIDGGSFCVSNDVLFTESSTIPDNNGAVISSWFWDFDDNNNTSTAQEPSYRYSSSGIYDVTLEVTTNEGCKHDTLRTIQVGPVPKINFSWSAFCQGDNTQFTDLTDAGISTIIQYNWEFGDGFDVINNYPAQIPTDPVPPAQNNSGRTAGTFKNPSHRYDTFGQKNVRLEVLTNDGCLRDTTITVTILDYSAPTLVTNYFEDFEGGQGSWFSAKANLVGVASDTSWVFGLPSGNVINSASSGTNAFWTGLNPNFALNQDKARYYNNERSAVIGPCLDLTNIKRPMISLDYWADSEDRFDGAVLQYSIDGGATWQTIGDDAGAGINWYNGRALTGNPGIQPIGQFGWTGRQGGWKNARYNLDQIPMAYRDKVIIRIAFGSNNDNGTPPPVNGVPDLPFEGFAFDNIFIGEKQRNVLVEYFTNAGISPVTNDYLNNLYNNQFTFKDSSDFFKIQYHIANPVADPINQANPGDPAARALLYGVSQPPVGIMDGILYNYYGTAFNGDQTKITATTVDRRALEDPLFRIGVTQVPTNDPTTLDSLHINLRLAYLKPSQPFSGRLFLHAALVESNVSGNINVVRKLLLSPEGYLFNRTWLDTVSQTVTIKTVIDAPIGINNPNLWLAVWAQEDATKTVLQSRLVKLPVRNRTNIVGVEDGPALAQIRDIVIYPNPASKQFNFAVEQQFALPVRTEGFAFSIIDQRGVVVQSGKLNEDLSTPQQVDVQNLASGMYLVTISRGGKVVAQRKLVILHRH